MAIVWLILLTVLWPILQLLVALIGFGRIDSALIGDSAVFLPMGLVGAIALVYAWRRAPDRRRRIGATVGYIAASPAALLGAILGGLALPPVVGTLAFGGLPLVAGVALGYGLTSLRIGPGRAGAIGES